MWKLIFLLCFVALTAAIEELVEHDSPQLTPNIKLSFGDVALTPLQRYSLNRQKLGYNAVIGAHLRWKDAIIPYAIDCSIENLQDAVDAIHKAMAQWERKTCIRFVKHTNQKYFLTFFRNTHCWGNVGQVSYSRISVGYGCEYEHVMAHEIGHVVGLYHEQNRKDRDQWVKVHWENIGQFRDAFEIVKNTDPLGIKYDYASIMHYPWTAFSSNGKKTMEPIKPTEGKVPYIEISKDDIELVSRMYKCKAIERKRHYQRKRYRVASEEIVCVDQHKECPMWRQWGHCKLSSRVFHDCPKTCNVKCGGGLEPLTTKPPVTQSLTESSLGKDWAIRNNLNEEIVCVDQHKECPMWRQWGHCKLSSRVFHDCPKTCNVKRGGGLEPLPTKPPVTQNRTESHLGKDWPIRSSLNEEIVCVDIRKECPMWRQWGHCKLSPRVFHDCPKSCNVKCGGGVDPLPTQPPLTQIPVTELPVGKDWPNRNYLGVGILCLDRHPKCAEWAEQGECKRNPGYMLRGCMKSCTLKGYKILCDLGVKKPPGKCANPLGLAWDGTKNRKIPDSAFSAPEFLARDKWSAPGASARLYNEDDYTGKKIGAWCAASHKPQYVQVDLGQKKTINHIATQGRPKYFERVEYFKIQYSDTPSNFKTYQESGSEKIFTGNCDHRSPVLNHFKSGINARYIRYIPVKWNWPCVRMELYGC